MTYASFNDLLERAGETELVDVADRDDDGVPDAEIIQAALVHADNLINGYVAARYPVTFVSVPPLLNTWAVSIARYYLHRYGPPEYVENDFKEAIAALKDVARGLINLPAPDGSVPDNPTAAHGACHPPEVFTKAFLQGWR